jgi:hypothetical protein
MPDFAAVDVLIRELGAVRQAAHSALPAPDSERAALETAIGLASEAVDRVIDAPEDLYVISRARTALDAAEHVVAALVNEVERSQRLRAEARGLTARTQELLRDARGLQRF